MEEKLLKKLSEEQQSRLEEMKRSFSSLVGSKEENDFGIASPSKMQPLAEELQKLTRKVQSIE